MKHAVAVLLIVVFTSISMAAQQNSVPVSKNGEYGKGVSSSAQAETLTSAIDAKRTTKLSVVTGEVTDVCAAKGCWMMLQDGENEVRVTFKDYGFFVPSSLIGKQVVVQGVLSSETISEATRRHYAEDAGATEEQIAEIVGDKEEYVFEATGVKEVQP